MLAKCLLRIGRQVSACVELELGKASFGGSVA
jgi:hypothetical protein